MIPGYGHFLATNSSASGGPYSGAVAGNQTFTTGISDDGGIGLLNGTTVIDQVGMSTSSAYKEGTPLAPLTTTGVNRCYERKPGGTAGNSIDGDTNSLDFQIISPCLPQNLSSAATPPSGPTNPSSTGSATPSTVAPGNMTLLTVAVTPGTNPASTGVTVVGDLSAVGGNAAQQFFDDGATGGDATAGDNVFSYTATVALGTAAGQKNLPVTITDAQSRAGSATITVTVPTPPVGAQTLPYTQNWSNVGQITTDNDWSGVAGVRGYRGDDLTTSTGVDPQTILVDGSATPLNVLANQTDPSLATSGGVAEFELANPTVAIKGSGTADAPHIVINLDTTNQSNITVFYNLRDLDASANNSVQPVALQYRIGSTGNYTNVPAGFVADASTGPDEATEVTPVAAALPSAVNNQSLVQLRIITANAVGSDEWIGIDDINITVNGTLPVTGSGAASPNQVNPGEGTLLTVTVSPGSNPTSTNITVSGDLSSIGGSAS